MDPIPECDVDRRDGDENEAGFALISILVIVIPLALIVATSTSLMRTRTAGILAQIRNEKAFLAAECGIDEALFQAQTGALTSGVRIIGDLGNGMTYTVMPLYLGSDLVDNDGDTLVDEADEDVFRLLVEGKFQHGVKKVAAYLGRTSSLPMINSAAMIADLNPGTETILDIDNTSSISGWEGGNPASGTGVPGLAIPVGSTTAATNRFRPGYGSRLDGTPAGLAETAVSFDIASFVAAIRNSADIVINGELTGATLGDAATNDFKIIYGKGEVELGAGTTGAGILVVEGSLELEDNAHFDGLVIVLGEMELEANSSINGALVLGSGPENGVSGAPQLELELEDGSSINYSLAMLSLISSIMPGGKWVTFNGWQELSRHETTGF